MGKDVAHRHVNRVRPGFLDPFADVDRFFQNVAFLLPGVESAPFVDRVGLDLEMEVIAHFPADRPDNFEEKPRAVFERAAVFVFPVVDRRAQETA